MEVRRQPIAALSAQTMRKPPCTSRYRNHESSFLGRLRNCFKSVTLHRQAEIGQMRVAFGRNWPDFGQFGPRWTKCDRIRRAGARKVFRASSLDACFSANMRRDHKRAPLKRVASHHRPLECVARRAGLAQTAISMWPQLQPSTYPVRPHHLFRRPQRRQMRRMWHESDRGTQQRQIGQTAWGPPRAQLTWRTPTYSRSAGRPCFCWLHRYMRLTAHSWRLATMVESFVRDKRSSFCAPLCASL